MICAAHQILGDKIKKDKMGRECSMHGGKKKCIPGFGWET